MRFTGKLVLLAFTALLTLPAFGASILEMLKRLMANL
jgi:hypothetical protein